MLWRPALELMLLTVFQDPLDIEDTAMKATIKTKRDKYIVRKN